MPQGSGGSNPLFRTNIDRRGPLLVRRSLGAEVADQIVVVGVASVVTSLLRAIAIEGNTRDPFMHALLGMTYERMPNAAKARGSGRVRTGMAAQQLADVKLASWLGFLYVSLFSM